MKNLILFFLALITLSVPSCKDNGKKEEPQTQMKLAAAIGSATAVSTFHSIGIFWSGSGSSLAEAQVQYRKVGDADWNNGYALWKDNRAIGGRPANEFRGSLVNLSPGTTYEIQLTAGSATASLTASTWSENFPIGSTAVLTGNITSGGTATGYKLYTGNYNGGITVNAAYVIIRGSTITGASDDAIVFGANAHDVVVENCDISGWGKPASTLGGNNQAAIRTKFTSSTQRLIIQRNKIHNPRYSASGWSTETAGDHPYGVNAINLEGSGGNNVIRYNDIYGDTDPASKIRFMDGVGGADNFTTTGAPGANSDIYGNNIRGCFDDGIEAEGGGMNVRVWGNFMNYTFTGVATATVAVGPLYVWNNVTNVGMRMSYVSSSEDRGPFNKCGSQDASVRGGRTYLFHNTVLQPSGNRGLCGGIIDNGGQVTNVISKNNLWTTAYTSKGGRDIGLWQGGSASSENDMLNSVQGSVTVTGKITSNPIYASSVGLELNADGYFLASNSPGKGKALALNNFSAGGDIGAYNGKKLEFGVLAYLGTTPEPPTNRPPVASAGPDKVITLPTNTVTLTGSGTDSDGSISAYKWTLNGNVVSNAANVSLTFSNAGTFVYTLAVTDDKGATATDNVTVTVNPATPVPPVLRFAVYQTIITVYSDSTKSQSKIVF